MNEKGLKTYQDKLLSGASGTVKLGVVTGVGSFVMGSIGGSVPGAAPGLASANAALNLANVGNLAAVGMNLMPGKSKTTPQKTVSKVPVKKGTPMSNPAAYF